jgi:hypothetical protein
MTSLYQKENLKQAKSKKSFQNVLTVFKKGSNIIVKGGYECWKK